MSNAAILRCGDLCARVLYPKNNRYARTRFNHSGFISDVWYKGMRYTQYERSQATGPTTEGNGLCCEYDCSAIEADTPAGEEFLKFGVGKVRRRGGAPVAPGTPEFIPLDTECVMTEDQARFHTRSELVGGYAYDESRIILLQDSVIREDVTLVNVGDKPFTVGEYCHNFTSLGDREIGPGYHLAVPSLAHPEELAPNGVLRPVVGGFNFADTPEKPFYVRTNDTCAASPAWTLTHDECDASLCETVSFTPEHIAVWGDYYVISAEIFHQISLQPGESATWTRTWTFA